MALACGGPSEVAPSETEGVVALAVTANALPIQGFGLAIDGVAAVGPSSATESVSGAQSPVRLGVTDAGLIEVVATTVGGDTFHTFSPGHRAVGEITLTGAFSTGRDRKSVV